MPSKQRSLSPPKPSRRKGYVALWSKASREHSPLDYNISIYDDGDNFHATINDGLDPRITEALALEHLVEAAWILQKRIRNLGDPRSLRNQRLPNKAEVRVLKPADAGKPNPHPGKT